MAVFMAEAMAVFMAEAMAVFMAEAMAVFMAEAMAVFMAEAMAVFTVEAMVTATDSVSALVSALIGVGDTRITTDMARGEALTLTTIRTTLTTIRMVQITLGIIATLATTAIIAMKMIIRANQIMKMLRQSLRAEMFPKALLSVIM